MDVGSIKKAITELVEERKAELTAIAEELYRSPETGLQEYKSAALLTGVLEREGFLLERGLAGLATAFRASSGVQGPAIAILAEMDALPEIGHACGHNIIAAAAIGAAIALRHALPEEAARIIVLGTPAEELGIGKCELLKAGCFHDVDFALMVHPSSKRQVLKMYLGLAKVHFTFYGKPAHAAAYPEEGVNALDGAIQTFNGINALRQHVRQDVRVHGIITQGGVAPNIIPEKASCSFYVRADDLAEVERVKKRVIACAQGAAVASGCRLDVVEDERVLAPMKINRAFSALYSRQLEYLHLPESMAPADKNKGSSDIGNVSQVVPTIHPHVPIGDGIHIHSEGFARATISDQGKAAVIEGALALALTAAELAVYPAVRDAIRQEFISA
ncbi:MAG TPA: M20 family metallopeptidase [Geobacteraceae bacterium]|nr:M20 family metallopeptidase [Geobacteraceae bacterium]